MYYRPPDAAWPLPVLIVHGPLHQDIQYDFGQPGSTPPQRWSRTSEGANDWIAVDRPIQWPQ
jgi:hypothetical protein